MTRRAALRARRAAGAAALALAAAAAGAQTQSPGGLVGAFFHGTRGTFAEDIARVADLSEFGLNVWIPPAHDQAELDAWLAAADAAGASVIFTHLGNESPEDPDRPEDALNLDRFSRVCRMTLEAEDSVTIQPLPDLGAAPTRLTDPAARTGITADTDAGNAVRLPAGARTALRAHPDNHQYFWLRRCGTQPFAGETQVDAAGVRYRDEILRVRLRVDEATGPSLAELRATDPTAVVARLRVGYGDHDASHLLRVSDIESPAFETIAVAVPFYRTGTVHSHLDFELESTGVAALVVDRFRFENARAHRLFGGEFDDEIASQAAACHSPRCIRNYIGDEPEYAEWEAWRHVDSVITERVGRRALTALYWAIEPEMARRWALWVRPAELLVDPYPFTHPRAAPHLPADAPPGHALPPFEASLYAGQTRAALDAYADDLAGASRAAAAAGVPLWLVLQQHGVARVAGNPPPPADGHDHRPSGHGTLGYEYRPPTPEEARVQALMGLAHGARAFFHFLYKSLDGCGANGCEAYVGLVGPSHEREETALYAGAAPLNALWTDYAGRWEAAALLNRRLSAMGEALARWDVGYAGPAYRGDVTHPVEGVFEGGAPAEDVHLGVFTSAADVGATERRLVVVNRRLGPDDLRELAVDLAPSGNWRIVVDLEGLDTLAVLPPGAGSVALSLAPGDGRLLAVTHSDASPTGVMPSLAGPWPNPATAAVSATLWVPAAGRAVATVHDVLGRRVLEIVDGPLDAGRRELRWQTAGLAAGVYVLRVEIEGALLSAPFTVTR